jgi:hypothetical protein
MQIVPSRPEASVYVWADTGEQLRIGLSVWDGVHQCTHWLNENEARLLLQFLGSAIDILALANEAARHQHDRDMGRSDPQRGESHTSPF